LPGTSADNDAWIRRKNNVVNRLVVDVLREFLAGQVG
jgi:uncharacterized protein (UPF0303 family)